MVRSKYRVFWQPHYRRYDTALKLYLGDILYPKPEPAIIIACYFTSGYSDISKCQKNISIARLPLLKSGF